MKIECRISRSTINRNAWKVWVVGPPIVGIGWLRGGFAWKTRQGAINAARKAYPHSVILAQD